MLEALENLDRSLFIYLNSKHSGFWDVIMVAVSERVFWIPFYILIVGYIIYTYRIKGLILLALLGVTVIAADQISASLIKPYFARLRPCHELSLENLINVVDGCGGKFGFLSSHATNFFALAVYLNLTLSKKYKYFKIFLLIWAAFISYSRVYLGVHYPGDIISGALLGTLLAYLFSKIYKIVLKKYYPDNLSQATRNNVI